MINDPETLTGVILNGAHGIYDVHTDDGVLRCTLRGKLKKAFAQAQSAKSLGKFVLGTIRSCSQHRALNEWNDATRVSRHCPHDYQWAIM